MNFLFILHFCSFLLEASFASTISNTTEEISDSLSFLLPSKSLDSLETGKNEISLAPLETRDLIITYKEGNYENFSLSSEQFLLKNFYLVEIAADLNSSKDTQRLKTIEIGDVVYVVDTIHRRLYYFDYSNLLFDFTLLAVSRYFIDIPLLPPSHRITNMLLVFFYEPFQSLIIIEDKSLIMIDISIPQIPLIFSAVKLDHNSRLILCSFQKEPTNHKMVCLGEDSTLYFFNLANPYLCENYRNMTLNNWSVSKILAIEFKFHAVLLYDSIKGLIEIDIEEGNYESKYFETNDNITNLLCLRTDHYLMTRHNGDGSYSALLLNPSLQQKNPLLENFHLRFSNDEGKSDFFSYREGEIQYFLDPLSFLMINSNNKNIIVLNHSLLLTDFENSKIFNLSSKALSVKKYHDTLFSIYLSRSRLYLIKANITNRITVDFKNFSLELHKFIYRINKETVNCSFRDQNDSEMCVSFMRMSLEPSGQSNENRFLFPEITEILLKLGGTIILLGLLMASVLCLIKKRRSLNKNLSFKSIELSQVDEINI